MKPILTIPLLFITLASFAQKPLKITTEVDQFTGDTAIHTEAFSYQDPIGGQAGLKFMLHQKAGSYWIVSILNIDDLTTMDAGDQMVFKLAGGDMITVAAADYAISEYVSSNYHRLVTVYEISMDNITALAAKPIEMIRISTSDGNEDRPPSKKAAEACRLRFAQFMEYVR
jgi:hypothetical protein